MAIKNKVQLITYPDSLGGDLNTLNQLLTTYFTDIFEGGVHILPPFPSSGDRGFAPLTYSEIAPQFGTWDDIQAIGAQFDVLVDMMVNHISRQSAYFQDFVQHGRQSQWADLFITLDKIWPDGRPPREDVAKIFLRKPEHPFSDITVTDTGETERVWTSFGPRVDWSEQIDLDVNSSVTRALFRDWFKNFSEQGVKIVRLDAVAYVTKKRGTSCFFVEPEIYQFMEWITTLANEYGLTLLPEVHAHYALNRKLAERGYWIYDFILPGLVLFSLVNGDSRKLRDYLSAAPTKQFTTLDTYDGIPIQPDLDDILTVAESQSVVDAMMKRGANLNRILGKRLKHPGFDAHQINITYYDAVGRNNDAYLAARAIQFFSPGVPQLYYVGLLAGEGDHATMKESGEGRAVNRHNYTTAEVETELKRPVVQRLLRLIRFRNTHPSFDGSLEVLHSAAHEVRLRWRNGTAVSQVRVDLNTYNTSIAYTDEKGLSAELIV